MRLCTPHRVVPRTWTVELRPRPDGPALYCPRCTPAGHPLGTAAARPAALAHLARHARSDALPAHLRTCQCHDHGCRWHPRHRGCAGPVLLVLTRDHGGRTWRLTDVCAACATATPHTAVVPDHALTAPSRQPRTASDPVRARPRGPSGRIRVQDMLSYLASALPTSASAEARLLALQCVLRADAHGQVRLPTGLLRGMRLGPTLTAWHELEEHRWLQPAHRDPSGIAGSLAVAHLLDPLPPAPGRPGRTRAADWALRVTSRTPLKTLPPGARLAALALTAHHSPSSAPACAEAERISRACGSDPAGLGRLLDQLLAARALTTWVYDRVTEELHWTSPPNRVAP
ncbi:hypothetical protein [Streptomyces sp. H27-D2]|uniref:hypothetical protein n=1 Tax=Streptomyces sp. H27-D2 TaxID=3046304 RepID=UPI002DB5A0DD|nr:hypothetical protein [Streptomyces sp. H27-D2]MEC4021023.1 hypothetical protein [Streptomyces sp. H27-D2]